MFDDIRQDIYGVFASVGWTGTGYKAYPASYQGAIASKPYVLISIIPAQPEVVDTSRRKSMTGLMIVSIYVGTDKGHKELFEVGDALNNLFQEKVLANGTQFGLGAVRPIGPDKDNSSLYRGDYSIKFTLYGD